MNKDSSQRFKQLITDGICRDIWRSALLTPLTTGHKLGSFYLYYFHPLAKTCWEIKRNCLPTIADIALIADIAPQFRLKLCNDYERWYVLDIRLRTAKAWTSVTEFKSGAKMWIKIDWKSKRFNESDILFFITITQIWMHFWDNTLPGFGRLSSQSHSISFELIIDRFIIQDYPSLSDRCPTIEHSSGLSVDYSIIWILEADLNYIDLSFKSA